MQEFIENILSPVEPYMVIDGKEFFNPSSEWAHFAYSAFNENNSWN